MSAGSKQADNLYHNIQTATDTVDVFSFSRYGLFY